MNTTSFFRPAAGALALAATTALALAGAPAHARDSVPYAGTCNTQVTPISATQLRITGDCRLTHLGATQADTLQTVIPLGPPVMGVLLVQIHNDTTYRAANGDLLTMRFSGQGEIDLATGKVRFLGVEAFTGGTGRFAAASGLSSVEGTASLVSNRGQFVTRGRIAY